MLREERVVRVSYDAGRDELTLECAGPLSMSGPTNGQLLLDKAGFLVGVDLGQEPSRVVLMLGRHEDVDRTQAARLSVEARLVRIANAKRLARGGEQSPHTS